MNDDSPHNPFRELAWRSKLDPAQEAQLRAWLEAHPGAQSEWEAEAALTEALGRLPDTPVASNFTARVLKEVELEADADARGRVSSYVRWHGLWRWLPKAAVAVLLLAAALFSHQQIRSARLTRLAQSVGPISMVSSLPSPQILQDFDAIRILDRTPADGELLALLQ